MTENTAFQLCTRGIPIEHTQLFCWHNINPLVDFVERMVCSIAQKIIQQQWHSPSWASVGPLDANCRDRKKKRKPRTSRKKIKKTKTRIFSFLDKASTTQFVRSLTPNFDIKPRTSADLLTVDLATYFGDSKWVAGYCNDGRIEQPA